MGGKALAGKVFTRRYSRKEFDYLAASVLEKTRKYTTANLVPYRRTKEDFGDMDVVVCDVSPNLDIGRLIATEFAPKAYLSNGNVKSFEVDELQVDFIVHSKEDYDIALAYYAYEAGNFMGRMARRFNAKFGHDGLSLPVRMNNTNELGPISITKDVDTCFDLLGFDLARLREGFDTLEEFYRWVIESKYFDPHSFYFENLNHINRTRNRKRPIYSEFVDIINSPGFDSGWRDYAWGESRFCNYLECKGIFKQKNDKLKAARLAQSARNNLSEYLRSTGLEGKALGAEMTRVKVYYGERFLDLFNGPAHMIPALCYVVKDTYTHDTR